MILYVQSKYHAASRFLQTTGIQPYAGIHQWLNLTNQG
jgi:hypothetical protein